MLMEMRDWRYFRQSRQEIILHGFESSIGLVLNVQKLCVITKRRRSRTGSYIAGESR